MWTRVCVVLFSQLMFLLTIGLAEDAKPAAAAPAKDLKVGSLQASKVLFLGNSITLHGVAPHLGWNLNCGMAASAPEKDYVHLVTAKLAKAAGGEPQVMVKNIADFEREFETYDLEAGLKDELAFEPQMVIVAIGENVAPLATDEVKAKYQAAFARLLSTLQKHGNPVIFVRSSFWADPAKDGAMEQASAAAPGVVFLKISELNKDPKNTASSERKFEHPGVAGHPGDRGMKAIADAIWTTIEKRAAVKP
jgi:lysophospholipase L1-like esterase